ncbi:MAG: hypothetical protein F9K40_01810 [Kofleriaceae bacterium]|nr:MAG: hypothetical protein F9K40_01810 [Kofleriaceae bacterium]MBZ0235794.1 hypothetical protein [Kofleriaceae bacterium]
MVRTVVSMIGAALLVACVGGGSGSSGAAGGAAKAEEAAFELDCEGSATDTSGQVYCVRTDTRTGDVLKVDMSKLPISNGPVGAAAGPAGRYETECVAVNMAERSDFACVRLNTESGELLLVNLQKVDSTPK